MAFNRFI